MCAIKVHTSYLTSKRRRDRNDSSVSSTVSSLRRMDWRCHLSRKSLSDNLLSFIVCTREWWSMFLAYVSHAIKLCSQANLYVPRVSPLQNSALYMWATFSEAPWIWSACCCSGHSLHASHVFTFRNHMHFTAIAVSGAVLPASANLVRISKQPRKLTGRRPQMCIHWR